MIAFKDITPEIAAAEWERFKNLSGNDHANQPQLGKVLVWCDRLQTGSTIQKYVRLHYGVEKIHNSTYTCAKVFQAVLDSRFPMLTEAEFDNLTLRHIMRVSRHLHDITGEELAEMLRNGIDGKSARRRRSKRADYPRAGYIYVAVSSASAIEAKLGETRVHPDERVFGLRAQPGVGSAAPIPVWWEYVSDTIKAEKELHAPFLDKKHRTKKDWFFIRPKEGIARAMEVARLYQVPTK